MLSDIFQFARKSGMAKLEEDVENPEKSATFSKYPKLLKDHHMLHFICDTLRMSVSGVVPPHDLDAMMENDIDMHHHEAMTPVRALVDGRRRAAGPGNRGGGAGRGDHDGGAGRTAGRDRRKGGGGAGRDVPGNIALLRGGSRPIAANMEKIIDAETQFYQMLRAGLMAFAKGMAPMIAVEFARRAIPHEMRPTFKEMEAACKGDGAVAPAAKAA